MSRRFVNRGPAHCAQHGAGVLCDSTCAGRFTIAPASRNTNELESVRPSDIASGDRTAPVHCSIHAPGMLCDADCAGRLTAPAPAPWFEEDYGTDEPLPLDTSDEGDNGTDGDAVGAETLGEMERAFDALVDQGEGER